MTSFRRVFIPSTALDDMMPRAVNQFRIKPRWRRSVLAIFFMGSSCDRMKRRHQSSRNRPTQYGLV